MEPERKGKVIAHVQCRPCPLARPMTLKQWEEWRLAEDKWMHEEMQRQVSEYFERFNRIEQAVSRGSMDGTTHFWGEPDPKGNGDA
jgi:hypothetical protein